MSPILNKKWIVTRGWRLTLWRIEPLPLASSVKLCADTHRNFVLRDPVANSRERPQAAGIAQGCPLSPYLFVIVQSVMFFDVDGRMVGLHSDIQEPDYLACSDILYADDTMLLSSDSGKLQALLNTVIDEGAR